ncbi:MAG: Trm112 family protein [Elusimicrobia bacterium]|nr:Trm112 family protein [Elusimicrobiota bacterium]
MIKEELLSILACPKCKGPIVAVDETEKPGEQRTGPSLQYLDCRKCRLRYKIHDGIPVMLIDEAQGY